MTEIFFRNIHDFPPKCADRPSENRLDRSDLLALKENIAGGSYKVVPGQIADKILSAQLFLFNDRC